MKTRLWITRALILIVTFWNLDCAVSFLVAPGGYAPGFELSGDVGSAVIRSLGLLFIMWNVPYVVALIQPVRYRVSLLEALIMQCIGVTGETILLLSLPAGHPALTASIVRFILFDASGFVLLLAAYLLFRRTAE